jgi:transcriptional regulator with XRE-family HTH domain
MHKFARGANPCTNPRACQRSGDGDTAPPGGEDRGDTASQGVGRHLTRVLSVGDAGPQWNRRYRCEWGEVVGGRVRRLRQAHGLSLAQTAASFHRPDGGHYSPGFLSRLERGWASPPLWVYVALAELFAVAPGRLLGPNHVAMEISEPEVTLLRLLRRLRIEPDEAIARLLRAVG